MAILTALFSLIGKQLGKIVQAIFGWAITALFGRLPSTQQVALSAALIASLAWPVLVVGAFFPGVAAWALAFLPLHKWFGDFALRMIWTALAVLVPIAVGGIARWVTPASQLKGGLVRTLLSGYPLTLGYFIAFVVTAITVPIVQLVSLTKGWDDEHIYVQSKPHHYEKVLGELEVACKAAGLSVAIGPVPTAMQLATRAMKWFASPAMSPALDAEPQRLVGKELEVYLYPSDLLLRGKGECVAHVRAAMTRTRIEDHAHLTSEPAAQKIEEEIGELGAVVTRHQDRGESIRTIADTRLAEIAKKADTVTMSFDSWTILQTGIRRIERALESSGHKPLPESGTMDGKSGVQAIVARDARPFTQDAASATALLEKGVAQAKDLVALEVALATDEARTELEGVKTSAISFGVALACALSGVAGLVTALVMVTSPMVGLLAGLVLLASAGLLFWRGRGRLPAHPMEKTKGRLIKDVNRIRESLA